MNEPRLFTLDNSSDHRGSFAKIANSLSKSFPDFFNNDVQIFYSISKRSVIRGFHYQTDDFSSTRLIICINGNINDHTVNMDPKNEKYGKVVTFNMQSNDFVGLIVPPNYAHGFETLSDNATLLYITNRSYNPNYDKVINPMSFDNIWVTKKPIMSLRDSTAPLFPK
jgi:dTDP-4-dehydrorhamnose 3,5-epimerase